ncbi:hypothetical protein EVA_11443 [gut metagenome]|uniref:Uncharacterized protein n=1 Tax=gut metagenome TaxID=749906 RepID=J9GF66_9ZZZZ
MCSSCIPSIKRSAVIITSSAGIRFKSCSYKRIVGRTSSATCSGIS